MINQVYDYSENGAGTLNLDVKNYRSNFLEGRIGFDFSAEYSFEHRTKYNSHNGFLRAKYNF